VSNVLEQIYQNLGYQTQSLLSENSDGSSKKVHWAPHYTSCCSFFST
jgi:hypothetical protein